MGWLIAVAVVFAIAVLVGGYLWVMYNALTRLSVSVDESWSGVAVQLKRRADLLPNLVEAVKGYAAHEKTVLENLAQARTELLSADGPTTAKAAEGHLDKALKSLFAVAESYPELRASQNYLQFSDALTDTEDKIQAARRFYNSNVRSLNTHIKMFPNNIIAPIFNFQGRSFFDAPDDSMIDVPKIKF